MAEVDVGVDAINIRLTGGSVREDTQMDHAASLGGHRSSERVPCLTPHRLNAVSNITITFVAGRNGEGIGNLVADSTSSLRWTPPGGAPGASVTIANGETKVLYGASPDADSYIIVTRTSATELGGSETVQLLQTINNVVGGSNFDGDDEAAGAEKYRALMFLSNAATNVTDLKVWIDDDFDTDLRIAKETPDGTGALTVVANEDSQPGGLVWVTPVTEGTALALGTVIPGGEIGLWIERKIVAASGANPDVVTVLNYKYTLSGTDYTGNLCGVSRNAENGLKDFLVWVGTNADPDTSGAEDDSFDVGDLPYLIDNALAADNNYHHIILSQNEYGLRSLVEEALIVRIDAGGDELEEPPSGPSTVQAKAIEDGKAQVTASYQPATEGLTAAAIAAKRATSWLIYVSVDGTDPDPALDSPTVVAMNEIGNAEQLVWPTPAGYVEDTPIRFLVRTRRDTFDSENVDIHEQLSEPWGPARPKGAVSIGRFRGIYQSPITGPTENVFIDVARNIYWQVIPGEVRLWADTKLIWNLRATTRTNSRQGLHTYFSRKYGAISGAGTGAVEVGTWDGAAKELYFNVAGVRRMKVDAVAETIEMILFRPADTLEISLADVPIYGKYASTVFQCWDLITEDWITAASLNAAGTFAMLPGVSWRGRADQATCLA